MTTIVRKYSDAELKAFGEALAHEVNVRADAVQRSNPELSQDDCLALAIVQLDRDIPAA